MPGPGPGARIGWADADVATKLASMYYAPLMSLPEATSDTDRYRRIAQAIEFLRDHHREQPELRDLAANIGLSESHTQRLFSRWVGISPKRFLQYLTVEHAKRQMQATGDLLNLALDTGLSGPGRLHDLFVTMEAMSPGEFKRAATGLEIRYGLGPTPFGTALIASTSRGICHLSFVDSTRADRTIETLREAWSTATLVADDVGSAKLLARVFEPPDDGRGQGLSLWVSGSNFQIQVWRAMLRLPFGGLVSYRQLAESIGRPNAARAVGTAVARNRIAYLIPCHRVLRGNGECGDYHWGSTRKAAINGWEAAHVDLSGSG